MGVGVVLMLLVIAMSLGEVPAGSTARAVLLVAALTALGAGLVLYGLSRDTRP